MSSGRLSLISHKLSMFSLGALEHAQHFHSSMVLIYGIFLLNVADIEEAEEKACVMAPRRK